MAIVSGTVRVIEKAWFVVVAVWLAILIWGCIEGPKFFTNTDNTVEATAGTPSYVAQERLEQFFPSLSAQSPWLVVIQCDATVPGSCQGSDIPVISDSSRDFVEHLQDELFTEYPNVFLPNLTASFFRFNDTELDKLKYQHVSSDGLTTYVMWEATKDAPQSERYDAYHKLKSTIHKTYAEFCPHCYVGVTGADALTDDTTSGVAETVLHADFFVIPIAGVILIYMIGSWRLTLVTLFSMATAILGAFAIMNEVTKVTVPAQTITPQFVEVIAMAISIDYSLFFFTRFVAELKYRRALWHAQRTRFLAGAPDRASLMALAGPGAAEPECEDAEWMPLPSDDRPLRALVRASLMGALRHSGHVILVSGTTLLVAFLGFFFSGTTFLIQPAIANAIAIALCMLISLTAPIAFVAGFPAFFTNFNLWPDWAYACCCPARRRHQLGDVDFTGDEAEAEDPDEQSYADALAAVEAEQIFRTTSFSSTLARRGEPQPSQRLVSPLSRTQLLSDGVTPLTPELRAMHESLWFKLGTRLVRRPWNIIVLTTVFAAMLALGWQVFDMELSSSYALGIPKDSPAKFALETLQEAFSPGLVQPFDVVIAYTPPAGGAPAEEVEDLLLDVGVRTVAALVEHAEVGLGDIYSPFYYEGAYVDTRAKAYALIAMDPVYALMWSQQVSPPIPTDPVTEPVGVRLRVVLPFFAEELGEFLPDVRDRAFGAVDPPASVTLHLAGYKASETDTIDATQAKFPLMLGLTTTLVLVVVAVLLRSAFVPFRLLLTLILPMAATFGLTVLVYQKGILEWTGIDAFAPASPRAQYWDVPIFCFIVILGLALDYDVFLISRIAEFREQGFRNSAAVIRGLYATGPIITAAGVIMALSFGALLTLKSDASHAVGWLLVTSILIDTFIVRSLIVPCVMAGADRIGWWPRQVPRDNLLDVDGSSAQEVEGTAQYGAAMSYY